MEDLRPRLAGLTLRDEHRLRRRADRLRRHPDDDAHARLAAEIERAERRIAARRASVPAVSYPEQLPVSARREDLLAALRDHQVVIVAGETGSGKTTQLPKMCLELGRGVRGAIAHTQPRRLAARTVAERIADELSVELGGAVGYAVRFDDRGGQDTLVRLVTDGLLLAETRHDPLLRRYDTIIVDEAHERSLNIDFLLGYLHQLLPRRPDLRLVITSATIDPGRFSRHFSGAPIVEVSGRTYPVEQRYRPPADGTDPVDAIGDGVEEALRDGSGDVLVFLSGEREIRDAAEALRGRLGDRVEILPLYARLSTAEQRRVFQRAKGRRVVLATNVAETSLTVPGIGAVVDPGTARISRYSARLKVQRLPIEPVSQASANQRAGRCGRISAGICIRLYAEEDFLDRPAFTDPEILRTSLAAVILQMASLNLGEIEDFGFLDPPDRRQVRDGKALLHELGALEPAHPDPRKRLTAVGRRLAQLPVDPRLGRMVLEADRLDCADEVIVLVAALSIQDVRERPAEMRAQADQQHARFADEHSDFTEILNLWRYLREQQRDLSGNQFRKRCKAEYLHYLRIREWQDLAAQLRQAGRSVGIKRNREPAAAPEIHQALLSGLLSHVGLWDASKRDYEGARGARFSIFPGSRQARRPPPWVMVAELVETSRLFGRTVAKVDPRWIEPRASHLVRRQYSEPRWSAKRAGVMADERVTLYGLPIVAGRAVAYGSIDPSLSRDLFIRRALVEGDWRASHQFLTHNAERVAEVEALEERVRRRGLLVSDETLFDFFDERIPERIVSGAHFDRWWKDERRRRPELLDYTLELLTGEAPDVDPGGRPDVWKQGELELALTYRFEPGAEHDGVTVHVPLAELTELRATGFDWHVPAFREELVTTLLRALPKDMRRPLVPIPELAREIVPRLRPRKGTLRAAVAREVGATRGIAIDPAVWNGVALPAHLRMSFRVEAPGGEVLAEHTDLGALRERLRPRLRAALADAAAPLRRTGLRDWSVGTLPRTVTVPGGGAAATGYPALVDEGASVGVGAFESVAAQTAAMAAGTRRLLLLTMPSPARQAQRGLGSRAMLSLAAAPHGDAGAVVDDAIACAVDALVAGAGGPAWDEAGFRALHAHVAGGVAGMTGEVLRLIVAVLDEAGSVRERLARLPLDDRFREIRLDIAKQVGGLVFPGFATVAGLHRLREIPRYLAAAARRLDRLPASLAADLDRLGVVAELEADLARRREAGAAPEAVTAVRWLLQELRVAQFAQGLGVAEPVSVKRVRKALAEL